MMAATAQPVVRFHRHFVGNSHGDISYPPILFDRSRKAEEYVREEHGVHSLRKTMLKSWRDVDTLTRKQDQ